MSYCDYCYATDHASWRCPKLRVLGLLFGPGLLELIAGWVGL